MSKMMSDCGKCVDMHHFFMIPVPRVGGSSPFWRTKQCKSESFTHWWKIRICCFYTSVKCAGCGGGGLRAEPNETIFPRALHNCVFRTHTTLGQQVNGRGTDCDDGLKKQIVHLRQEYRRYRCEQTACDDKPPVHNVGGSCASGSFRSLSL